MLTKPSKLVALLAIVATTAAIGVAAPPAERAAPPEWTDADIEPFFADARQALVGDRAATHAAAAPLDAAGLDAAEFQWSRIVEGDTLATEVKRIAVRLSNPLVNRAAFKSGGNAECRTEFAMLAVLFAVIEEFDGDVRWQRDAAALREAAARVAENCRTASDQSYAAAARLRDDLDEVIRGGRYTGTVPDALDKWSLLADRDLLMQRMERAMKVGISPQLADARALAKAAIEVRHEAELLALLAAVIDREAYEYWDDETFTGYARDLGAAADDLSRAAADDNYEAARRAAGVVTNACAACHDGYRG